MEFDLAFCRPRRPESFPPAPSMARGSEIVLPFGNAATLNNTEAWKNRSTPNNGEETNETNQTTRNNTHQSAGRWTLWDTSMQYEMGGWVNISFHFCTKDEPIGPQRMKYPQSYYRLVVSVQEENDSCSCVGRVPHNGVDLGRYPESVSILALPSLWATGERDAGRKLFRLPAASSSHFAKAT
jgi:hypothetical protein